MKFSDMPYSRPELETTRAELVRLIDAFEAAPGAPAAMDAYMALDRFFSALSTMQALAYIRHSLDTRDEFYDAEQNYFDETLPLLREQSQRFEKALLASPHRAYLEEKLGGLVFDNTEMSVRTFIPEIVPDLQKENALSSEYDKLLASAQIPYDGKTLTLSQIAPYHQDKSREVRVSSLNARAGWFMERAGELDRLYDELIKARDGMARKMGHKGYIPLGYDRMTRNCYTPEMVARFRAAVKEHVVPVVSRIKAAQAARLGAQGIDVYDDPLFYPSGNPKPKGTPEDIFARGREMYHSLSEDSASFIDFMLENELFDVLSRTGKSGGGYCYEIADHRAPFIFANFNGTSGDIDVLTHEAGHALAGYVTRDVQPSALREYTYDTAEVHSMSMEYFAWPYMDGFFGDDAARYRYSHLSDALIFLPYGCMVDEFQHFAYENPGASPAERNARWLRLEGEYRPWLRLEGIPFYGEGRRWQAQSHIFERPFYYIDYCLAQTVALSFWALDQRDHGGAWKKYMRFLRGAGAKTFLGLVEEAGMPSPFVPDTVKALAAAAVSWLDAQPAFI